MLFRSDNKTIKNPKLTNRGREPELKFVVKADYSDILLNKEYLTNKSNYIIQPNNFSFEITENGNNEYLYTFSSKTVIKTPVVLKLKAKIPTWVEMSNDNEGKDIFSNDAMQKTFGLKYLIDGVYEGFIKNQDCYTELKINIK